MLLSMAPRRASGIALLLLASGAAAASHLGGPASPSPNAAAGALGSLSASAGQAAGGGPAALAPLGAAFDGSSALAPALAPVLLPSVRLLPLPSLPAASGWAPVGAPGSLAGSGLLRPDPLARLEGFDREVPGKGGQVDTLPGSIFDWKPAGSSPNHGFPPIDALVRRLASREDRRFDAGFTLPGSRREGASAYFYGERHTDRALIAENMRRLAEDLRGARPEAARGGIILDEGYVGPKLVGELALRYLEAKGFDRAWLGPDFPALKLEIVGWEDPRLYSDSRRVTLRYGMALYELNQHLHSDARGFGYYRELLSRAAALFGAWGEARRVAIEDRNGALDASLREALARSAEDGGSVHVIAGSEHLLESPLLAGLPLVGRPRLRHGLAEALGSRPYWAGKPASRRADVGELAVANAASAGEPASAEELAFAAGSALELARLADDIGAERGLKAKAMTGADFAAIIQAARARYAATAAASAPSPRALTAALAVQAHAERMARALLSRSEPLDSQIRRLLSVWTVLNQELEVAAGRSSVEAVEAEAKLFADQVEQSI